MFCYKHVHRSIGGAELSFPSMSNMATDSCNVNELLAQAERDEAEKLRSIAVDKELELEFDLGNLLACDMNRLEARDFTGEEKHNFLRSLARDNTQLLINELWKLPTDRIQEIVVAKLPEATTPLPREKPLPKPRPPTKVRSFCSISWFVRSRSLAVHCTLFSNFGFSNSVGFIRVLGFYQQ